MSRKARHLSIQQSGAADRLLRDATRAHQQRETELVSRIADLERQNRHLRAENAQRLLIGAPKLPPGFTRANPTSGEATGMRFVSFAHKHAERAKSEVEKRGRPGTTFNSMTRKSGGQRATTSSRSGAPPKVQGRAQ